MRIATKLFFVFILFSGQIVFAQNELVKTVFVSKHFTIKTNPRDADIIGFKENGIEEKMGSDSIDLTADKSEAYTIEVRKEGFEPVRRIYTRQKGGVEEDTVELPTRIVKLSVIPAGAGFYVNDINVSNGSYELHIPKGKSIKVEARYPGYVMRYKTFSNIPGEEEPLPDHTFKLKDRIVTLKAIPDDATILIDGKKAGVGRADVVIKKDSCVNVTVEHQGYLSKSVAYCNKDNEPEPVLSDEIQLRDRLVQFYAEPERAVISVDGKEMGADSCNVIVPEGKCMTVLVHAPGYAPMQQTICNKPGGNKPESICRIKLSEDEVNTKSEESNLVNTEFVVEVNPDLHADEAWKKLCSIIQDNLFEIDKQDAPVFFLRTKWAASAPFNATSPFPRIIRTRIDVSGGSKPLRYIINVRSDISKIGKDCMSEGMNYPPVSRDECFDTCQRTLRKYTEMISEIKARLGVTTAVNTELKTPGSGEQKMPLVQKENPVVQKENNEADGIINNTDGDYFIGTWHCINAADTVTVSKENGKYILERQGKKIKLNYKDDALMAINPAVGKVTFRDAHIIWQEKEYEDIKVLSYNNDNSVQAPDGAATVNKPESGNGDNFIGTWHSVNTQDTIVISKDGDNYALAQNGKTVSLNYRDAVLKNDDAAIGKVIFNPTTGHVYWQHKEFDYLTVAPVNTGNNVDNSTTVNSSNYPQGTIGDYMNDLESSQESYLFQITCDCNHPNKILFLGYQNSQEITPNTKYLYFSFFNGIENTHRADRMTANQYANHVKDTISYFVSYSDIDAHAVNLSSDQTFNYVAYLSFKITVKDVNGNTLFGDTFKWGYTPLERVHFPAFTSEEDAIAHGANKITEKITKFFSENLAVVTTVKGVDEQGHNGSAKMISLKCGDDLGVLEQTQFKIMCDNMQIGEVKVKSVDQNTSACKVTDGGDVIAAKLNSGKTLIAVSE